MRERNKIDVIPLIGKKFNHLTIIEYVGNIGGVKKVKAKCDCGKIKEYRLGNIIDNGRTKSCGCYNKLVAQKNNKKFITHGLTGNPLFSVWRGMVSRCYKPNNQDYNTYGGDGVTVCDEWKNNPTAFVNWAIANGWEKGLHLDKDKLALTKTGKIYSPEYCCFLTQAENSLYKRNSIMVEYNGQIKSLYEWATELKISRKLLQSRYRQGWDIKDMLEKPIQRGQLLEYMGIKKSLKDWAAHFGLRYETIFNRINYLGWDFDKAISSPLISPNQSGFHKKIKYE